MPEGITPACAGNSKVICLHRARYRDHPRLRGEQIFFLLGGKRMVGSPPLARGTERGRHGLLARRGITPACAGNRLYHRYIPTSRGDHPRLRGEQGILIGLFLCDVGSPPLARGTDKHQQRQRPLRRDHPRLRGEQLGDALNDIGGKGSPPLARGTGIHHKYYVDSSRITPACAGNREYLGV